MYMCGDERTKFSRHKVNFIVNVTTLAKKALWHYKCLCVAMIAITKIMFKILIKKKYRRLTN